MRADSDEFNKWLSVAIQSCCESWRSSILQKIENTKLLLFFCLVVYFLHEFNKNIIKFMRRDVPTDLCSCSTQTIKTVSCNIENWLYISGIMLYMTTM